MRSLRARLTLTHALVAFVGVLLAAALMSAATRVAFDRLTNRRIQAEASEAAAVLAQAYQRRQGWDGAEALLRRRLAQSGPNDPLKRRRLQVYDAQGVLVFDTLRPIVRRVQPKPRNAVESPIVVDGQVVGAVVMGGQIGEFTQAEASFLRLAAWSAVLGSGLAGLIALAVGRVISGRVTRPLGALRDAAQRLAGGARHQPLAIPHERELAELATSFNRMAGEIERQEQLRRQQVADIAHELRTPLSVLRLQIESIEDGVEQATPAALASLAEEVQLLSRLVDDLRLLSLADAGQLTLALDTVDAAEAIERTVQAAIPRARQQRIELRAEPVALALAAQADPQRLAQILGNLVENALRYTPAGGQVTLRAALDAQGAVVFEVADTGAGIAPAELAQIFERFYRADKARTRDTGGSGLGLAIARRLAELQGGRIWASSEPGQGARFYVALPRANVIARRSGDGARASNWE